MSLDADIQLLSRVKLFANFNPEALRLLAFSAEPRAIAQGTQLFRQNTPSNGGCVLVQGEIDLASGAGSTVVATLGPAALIGEMALISETDHATSAFAARDSEILIISRPLFRRMLEEYPEIATLMQQRISKSVDEFMKKLDKIRAKLDHASDLATRPKKGAA